MTGKNKNIFCSITSGLGNQLFQYAAGLHWQLNHGGNLLLDTSWYWLQRHHPKRSYRLGLFQIPENKTRIVQEAILFSLRISNKSKISNITDFILQKTGINQVSESDPHKPDFRFNTIGGSQKTCWLQGYWQTYEHFLAVRHLLINQLTPNFELSSWYKKLLNKIQDSDSIFVHIRRGDYTLWGQSILTTKYYSEAIDLFSNNKTWFIFSEDMEWCKKNLEFPGKTNYVIGHSENSDIEELLLMSACKGGIIANSSFSWWGAALGDREGRLIIGPKYRHGEEEGDLQKYRLLPSWKTISSF